MRTLSITGYEFKLSLSNLKYLDREFGSIQKLYARDADLLAFQENKVSMVPYGKNVLYDAVGGGQVVSIPEVLGGQVPFPGEYGISKNPESFAQWGNQASGKNIRVRVQVKPGLIHGYDHLLKRLLESNPKNEHRNTSV